MSSVHVTSHLYNPGMRTAAAMVQATARARCVAILFVSCTFSHAVLLQSCGPVATVTVYGVIIAQAGRVGSHLTIAAKTQVQAGAAQQFCSRGGGRNEPANETKI